MAAAKATKKSNAKAKAPAKAAPKKAAAKKSAAKKPAAKKAKAEVEKKPKAAAKKAAPAKVAKATAKKPAAKKPATKKKPEPATKKPAAKKAAETKAPAKVEKPETKKPVKAPAGKTPKAASAVKITANEMQVFIGIMNSEYYDANTPSGHVWSWSANTFDKPKTFNGAVASLVRKKLLKSAGTGKEAYLVVTDAGLKVIAENGITAQSKPAAIVPAKKAKATKRGSKENPQVLHGIQPPRAHVVSDKEAWFLTNAVIKSPKDFFDTKTLGTTIKSLIAKRADIRDALIKQAGNGIDDVTNVGSLGGFFARQMNRELGDVLKDKNIWETDKSRTVSLLGPVLTGLLEKHIADKAKTDVRLDRTEQAKKIHDRLVTLDAAKNTGDVEALRKIIKEIGEDATLSDASVCAIAIAANEWRLKVEDRAHQSPHPVHTREDALGVLESALPRAIEWNNRTTGMAKNGEGDPDEVAPVIQDEPEVVKEPTKKLARTPEIDAQVADEADRIEKAYLSSGTSAVRVIVDKLAEAATDSAKVGGDLRAMTMFGRLSYKISGNNSALFSTSVDMRKRLIVDLYLKRDAAKKKLESVKTKTSKTTASAKKAAPIGVKRKTAA
jgi:hypothetical protein